MEIMSDEERMMWDEARDWAVAEVLAKHRDELRAAHSKHYRRLTQRAADGDWECPKCHGLNASYYSECDHCGTANPRR